MPLNVAKLRLLYSGILLWIGWSVVSGNLSRLTAAPPADLVLWNAQLRTLEPSEPIAEAMAIQSGKIVAIGNKESIKRWIGSATQVIDAKNRLVVPGFNDAHVHWIAGGQQLSSVQLRDARTPNEFSERIAKFAKTLRKDQWITGGDWDHENWKDGALPHRQWIDPYTEKIPIFVTRLDGHMGLANSEALRRGNISKETPDPPGGLIVRDPVTGEPTGILKDAAMQLVTRHIPELTYEERCNAARAATNYAASLGVTSVQDMSGGSEVQVYRDLARRGELLTRIYAIAPLPRWQRSADEGLKGAIGDAWIRQGGLKGFADGSLGSTTAFFFDPYHDDPRTNGLPSDEMLPPTAMLERIRQADRIPLHIMIHAIGDRANDQILSFYEEVARENGVRDRRFRIEHAQHLRLQDISRFARGDVIASMQPYHCADDGRWAEKRIGPDRAKGTYAFRTLLDSGARLAFGSDWNVAPLNPLLGIAAAVTRRTLDGKNPSGWIPEQKISVEEAVTAYTFGSAYAEYTEHQKGTLRVGKLADCVMLSKDIFACDPNEIEGTQVVMTLVDGRVVYQSTREP